MNYRKKAIVIQAMQFKRDEGASIITHPCMSVHRWMRSHGDDGLGWTRVPVRELVGNTWEHKGYEYKPCISTDAGPLLVDEGDWIIRGTKGEFYPCKPDIFADIYEVADE